MKINKLCLSFLLVMLVIDTTAQTKIQITDKNMQLYLSKFSNLLSDKFFDKGSWLGISMSDSKMGIDKPLILSEDNGIQLNNPLLILSCKVNEQIFSPKITNSSLPWKLIQESKFQNCSVTLQSIFKNHQTILLSYTIANHSAKTINVALNWMPAIGYYTADNNSLIYKLKNTSLRIKFEQPLSKGESDSLVSNLSIPVNTAITKYIVIQYRFNQENEFEKISFKDARQCFIENTKRWYRYLIPYKKLSPEKQLLAAKCIQTLIGNWKAAAGELKHDGLFPSYGTFKGFWSWDSWKQAVALVTFEPTLAKDQIKAMFDYQDANGMIPDVIFYNGNHNWRDTKPPLAAWSVWEVFKATKDTSFVKELFPKLIKYHEWWYTNRDNNKNGLCEFGSTDGTIEAAKWESGMDNAIRFDKAEMLQNSQTAWSFNQESVDLNAYLCAEKKFLSALAKVLHEDNLAEKFEKEMPPLKSKLQNNFYDAQSKYFYDYNFKADSLIKVVGTEAWTVLWAGAATKEQAKKVVEKIMSTAHFNTYLPFPTISASNPNFDPENGYWRGLVWIDQAYFALTGMRKYGYTKEAQQMQNKLLHNAQGLFEKQQPIRENYNPLNGHGKNAQNFSWSATHILLLLRQEMHQ